MRNPLESEEAAFRWVLGALAYFVPIAIEYVLTVEKSKALSKSIFTSCAEASAGSIKADAVIRVRNNFKVHLLMVSSLALARTAPAGIARHWAGRIDGEGRKGMGSQHAVRPSRTTGVAIRRNHQTVEFKPTN